jgi:hypothetical protein
MVSDFKTRASSCRCERTSRHFASRGVEGRRRQAGPTRHGVSAAVCLHCESERAEPDALPALAESRLGVVRKAILTLIRGEESLQMVQIFRSLGANEALIQNSNKTVVQGPRRLAGPNDMPGKNLPRGNCDFQLRLPWTAAGALDSWGHSLGLPSLTPRPAAQVELHALGGRHSQPADGLQHFFGHDASVDQALAPAAEVGQIEVPMGRKTVRSEGRARNPDG